MTRLEVAVVVIASSALAGLVVDAHDLSWRSSLDAASGLALAACGITLNRHLRNGRPGLLFLAASVAWFAGTVIPAVAPAGAFGTAMVLTLHRGPLVHGIVAVLSRRGRSWSVVAAVSLAWITAIVGPLARLDAVSITLGASLVVAGLSFLRDARREPLTGVALVGACVYGAAIAIPAALRLGGIESDRAAIAVYMVVVATLSLALALAARGARESAVMALAIDLGDRPDGSTLRRALARAVGDPQLAIGIWLEDEHRYVDELGRALVNVSPDSGTLLVADGRRVGVLLHAPSTSYAAGIVDGAASVAALALENVRLEADAKRGVEELGAARRRIVEQTHEQRRLIGERIARGADRHLEAAESLLRRIGEALPDPALLDQLVEARASILSLATGLDASLPPEDRLRVAAERRSMRSPLPVVLRFEPIDLPDEWQHALLLVFAEAVTNAVKHSQGARISSDLLAIPGGVRMTITDDGIGGADANGFGLRGLGDRIEALGGSVEVVSGARGTTITATLSTDQPFTRRAGS